MTKRQTAKAMLAQIFETEIDACDATTKQKFDTALKQPDTMIRQLSQRQLKRLHMAAVILSRDLNASIVLGNGKGHYNLAGLEAYPRG
jgi:hypothetical protein